MLRGRVRIKWLMLVALGACSPRESGPELVDAVTPEVHAKGPRHDEIMEAIKKITNRQVCNRVTGCDAMVGLFQYGAELVEPAAEALARPDRGDNYWTIVLPEALGQVGDARAADVLVKLLHDRRWESRIAAAIGLSHLGPKAKAALPELERQAKLPDNEPLAGGDLAFRAALELALMRVSDDPKTHRDALLGLMPVEHALETPAPILDILVAIIGHARLSEALPTVRLALRTGNRFVVATALDVAGKLQDNGSIAAVMALLEADNPTIRKLAFKALTRITGATFDTAEQWRAWAVRVGLDIGAEPDGGRGAPPHPD